METLMSDILELASEKFGIDTDVENIDAIGIEIFAGPDDWMVCLTRPTKKANQLVDSFEHGVVVEKEIWFDHIAPTLMGALQALYKKLIDAEMVRKSNNRFVPEAE